MDVQTGLICLLLVIISGAVIFFVTIFGMQEKTYEEAIAEQRKMPSEALLLGRPVKEKSKKKKERRQGKKAKEKPNNRKIVPNKKGTINKTPTKGSKLKLKESEHSHVNFLTPEAEVLNKLNTSLNSNEKNKKKEKAKPILIVKKESGPKSKSGQKDVAINHFTDTIPKDDLQLKLINKKNNQTTTKSSKNQANFKENVIEKINKVKEKSVSRSPLKEVNKKADDKSNVESEKEVHKKAVKPNNEKEVLKKVVKVYNNEKENVKKAVNENKNEKNSVEKPIEKVKGKKVKDENLNEDKSKLDNKVKIEGSKNVKSDKSEKNKNGDNKVHSQKTQVEAKAVKSESNKTSHILAERVPLQVAKVSSHQHSNNKELKNKKHKKNELILLQQMTDRDGVNINFLIPLIRKAELSRTEVQILTDILLNKHLDEVADQFEWTEGRQDPVVKLKKQLAEREKALAEEQEASQAFQNKLKELRSEYNSERARLTQACRQYDETVLAKQSEIQNLHATNRHLIDSHVAEKQALTQKIQQLQAQVNDENLVIRKLQEDHNQAQNALQQELVNQGQQMEMHIGRLREQLQETQKNFEAQIHSKIQEAEQIRASFNAELQKNRRHEDELRDLREQQVQNQNKIKTLESRASQLNKETNNHTQELARQIEELQRANKELEIRYNNSHKMEEELKFEKSKLQNEIHSFTNKILDLQNEYEKILKEREKLASQVASKVDLEKEYYKLKEENQGLLSQVSSFTKIEREAQQLREENENLASQVTAFTERPAADGRENGDSPCIEEKKRNINVEFINHENEEQKDIIIEQIEDELKQKKSLIEKLNSQLDECQSEMTRLTSEVVKHKTEISKLKEALEIQWSKNDDLRKKNWKAMEALATTEKCLENAVKQSEKSAKVRLEEEQLAIRNLLKRIFPSIQIDEKVHKDWLHEYEKASKKYLEEIENYKQKSLNFDSAYVEELESKNNQLQTLVVHYKTIIEDTELMLNKLQKHVEHEEIRWRQQFETLEPQIHVLKDKLATVESRNESLESKVKELEGKNNLDVISLEKESNELKQMLEVQSEKNETLAREIMNLNSKLSEETNKNQELTKELEALQSSVKLEQNAYVEENKKRIKLEDELNFLKSEKTRELPVSNSGDFVAFEKSGIERQ